MLVTQAARTGFKRQNDYYDSTVPYWSPDHRLLDTAYMVNAFVISADSTEIPELEYVLEVEFLSVIILIILMCHDAVIGASDSSFKL